MTRESDAATTANRAAAHGHPGDGPAPVNGTAVGVGAGTQAPRAQRRRPRALTVVSVLAVALFALWGIGTPLIGGSSLSSTSEMVAQSPYAESGFAGSTTNDSFLDDTYTGEFPSVILYKDALKHGLTNGQWDPYMAGGVPMAATPNYALASPLTLVYYVLPTWLAPAYERLLEVVVAVGGCFLFLRRLKLSRPVAITAGMVFATSGFMVTWLDFPQTRVAAFIPVLFWTIERYLQERRLRDAALISIPIAAMLLGGFPAVTGYAVLTAGAYTLVRIAVEHRSALRGAWRPILGSGLGAAAGVGLAAFQLLPFSAFLHSWYTDGRAQTPTQHLDAATLLTAFAPWVFGGADENSPPLFYVSSNFIEALGYISAAAAVLVLVAFALQRSGRALLPRGVWVFFVVTTLAWIELIYVGGKPLQAMQTLPGLRSVFSINYIGRSRSILGFLLAVLAAVGFELLLRYRASRTSRPSRFGTAWAVGVGVVMAGITGVLLWRGEHDASNEQKQLKHAHTPGEPLSLFRHQILYSSLLLLAAIACVVLLRLAAKRRELPDYDRVWRKARFAAAAALPLLIAGQSISLLTQYYPKSNSDTFYPVTDTHSYLAANLGGQRYAAGGSAMVFGTNVAYGLRSVDGHAFINVPFATLLKGIPGNPVPFATYITLQASLATATSPILDTLGTKYFVTALGDPVLGSETPARSDGSRLTLRPGQSVTEPVPATGPLRGVGVTTQGAIPAALSAADPNSWLQVTLHDSAGAQVAQSRRLTDGLAADAPFLLPVAADSVAAGTQLTATFTLHATAPLTVAATNGTSPALTTVAGADDGLKLVHVETSAIYQRMTAQPRIRWASNSQVVTDQNQRMQMLAAGQVNGDSVLLSAQGPQAAGRPASVAVQNDGLDTISTTVNASGQGYLVVADADQVGWTATVDGKKTPLVPADEGVVAVPVSAGTHTVTLNFAAPHGTIAYALTAGTAVVLVAVVLGEVWWTRRRRDSGAFDVAEASVEER
jgi:hypothetical protein